MGHLRPVETRNDVKCAVERKGRCRFEVSHEDVHKPGPYMPPRSPPDTTKTRQFFFSYLSYVNTV